MFKFKKDIRAEIKHIADNVDKFVNSSIKNNEYAYVHKNVEVYFYKYSKSSLLYPLSYVSVHIMKTDYSHSKRRHRPHNIKLFWNEKKLLKTVFGKRVKDSRKKLLKDLLKSINFEEKNV